LTGVFPDHRSLLGTSVVARERLRRIAGLARDLDDDRIDDHGLLEELGRRWYRLVGSSAKEGRVPMTPNLEVAVEMGERFGDARRVLNVVTDQYLFPLRERVFGS